MLLPLQKKTKKKDLEHVGRVKSREQLLFDSLITSFQVDLVSDTKVVWTDGNLLRSKVDIPQNDWHDFNDEQLRAKIFLKVTVPEKSGLFLSDFWSVKFPSVDQRHQNMPETFAEVSNSNKWAKIENLSEANICYMLLQIQQWTFSHGLKQVRKQGVNGFRSDWRVKNANRAFWDL